MTDSKNQTLDPNTGTAIPGRQWVSAKTLHDRALLLPRHLKLLILDFDGVFTDNRVLVHQDGSESVFCDRSDGLRFPEIRDRGIDLLVLSTETNSVVQTRCNKLNLECVHGTLDKKSTLADILRNRSIDTDDVAYVGNDINDLECMQMVGCGIAVADAHPDVRHVARIVLSNLGGRGAVREVCDLILAQ